MGNNTGLNNEIYMFTAAAAHVSINHLSGPSAGPAKKGYMHENVLSSDKKDEIWLWNHCF
jgi:hypothetical protein